MRMQLNWLSLAVLFVLATVVHGARNPHVAPPVPHQIPPTGNGIKETTMKMPGNGIHCDGSRPLTYSDCDILVGKLENAEQGFVIPECIENSKGYAWAFGNCHIQIQNKTPNWGQHCVAPTKTIKRLRKTLHKCSPNKSATHNSSPDALWNGAFFWTEIRISPNPQKKIN